MNKIKQYVIVTIQSILIFTMYFIIMTLSEKGIAELAKTYYAHKLDVPNNKDNLKYIEAFIVQNPFWPIIARIGLIVVIILMIILIKKSKLCSLKFNKKGCVLFFVFGILALLVKAILIIIAFVSGSLNLSDYVFDKYTLLIKVAVYAILCLLIAFSEELMVRGYIFNKYKKVGRTSVAVIVSSAFFSASHFVSAATGIPIAIFYFTSGLLLVSIYIYTESIYAAIGYHLFYDLVVLIMQESLITPSYLRYQESFIQAAISSSINVLIILGLYLYNKKLNLNKNKQISSMAN